VTSNALSAGVSASWELDLFSRTRKGFRAADADILASTEDKRAVRLVVIGEVTRTYLATSRTHWR
jgi:outer membrane protein TolC